MRFRVLLTKLPIYEVTLHSNGHKTIQVTQEVNELNAEDFESILNKLKHKDNINFIKESSLTLGNWYWAELVPKTLEDDEDDEDGWLIKCDDGFLRKFNKKYFITNQDWRSLQIKKLDIE